MNFGFIAGVLIVLVATKFETVESSESRASCAARTTRVFRLLLLLLQTLLYVVDFIVAARKNIAALIFTIIVFIARIFRLLLPLLLLLL